MCGLHGDRNVIKSMTQVAMLILKRGKRDTDLENTEDFWLDSDYPPIYLSIYTCTHTHTSLTLEV